MYLNDVLIEGKQRHEPNINCDMNLSNMIQNRLILLSSSNHKETVKDQHKHGHVKYMNVTEMH